MTFDARPWESAWKKFTRGILPSGCVSHAGITADILLNPLSLLWREVRKGTVCFSANIHFCLGTIKAARASQSMKLFLIVVIFGIEERRSQEEFNTAVRSGKRDTSCLKNKHKGATRRFMACRLNNRKEILWFRIYSETKFPDSDTKQLFVLNCRIRRSSTKEI